MACELVMESLTLEMSQNHMQLLFGKTPKKENLNFKLIDSSSDELVLVSSREIPLR